MPISKQDLIDKINAKIKKNDRKSITGVILNDVLQDVVETSFNLDNSLPATGTNIEFSSPKIYNSPGSPATANITADLTDADLGIIQKIYHNHSVAPTFPAGWVLIGVNTYTVSVLNIIYAEFVGGTRVEYWIIRG